MSASPELIQHGSHGVALSTNVAMVFHKNHRNVTSRIDKHITDIERDGRDPVLYFKRRNYVGSDGKEHREYEISRIGFDVLVLSFNGKTAFSYKLKYIDMFYAYERAALKIQANKASIEWTTARALGKQAHREYTEQGKAFLEYAAIQRGNDRYARHFYSNLATAKLNALFAFPLSVKPARDLVSPKQLRRLEGTDLVADRALLSGMRDRKPHKVIYQDSVKAVKVFADLSGGIEPVEVQP
ncbi:MAG: Rha family transcriptional regulator [Gallionellaceae bacterium]